MHLSGQGVEYIMMKENKGDTRFLKYPSPHHNLILDFWYQAMMERSPPVLNNNWIHFFSFPSLYHSWDNISKLLSRTTGGSLCEIQFQRKEEE
jgi:hypothetical protein